MSNGLGISGVPLDNVSMQETLDRIEEFICGGGRHQVATANVDYLVNATQDQEYRRILCMCDLVVADGMPVVWASRLFGVPLTERVTGADLVPELARLSSKKGYGIFLLGTTSAVAEAAVRRLEAMSPGVRICGRLSPPVRPLEEFDNEAILDAIAQARPDILLVAFGSPKQEKWISRNRHALNVPVAIGIGGSLEFLAGKVRRAPRWMQKYSLEWFFRMWEEPGRLAPRYFNDAVWLARYLGKNLVRDQIGRRRSEDLRLGMESIGSIHLVRVSGVVAGPQLSSLARTVSSAIDSGRPVVLDMSETSYLGADGLWTLAGLLRSATNRGCELRLSGLSAPLTRSLRATCFEDMIPSTPSALEAVRQISRGRLQIHLELGESWATCRISGDLPDGARATLGEICHSLRLANEHFELDASGMADFDPGDLLAPVRSGGRVAYVDARKVAGAA